MNNTNDNDTQRDMSAMADIMQPPDGTADPTGDNYKPLVKEKEADAWDEEYNETPQPVSAMGNDN